MGVGRWEMGRIIPVTPPYSLLPPPKHYKKTTPINSQIDTYLNPIYFLFFFTEFQLPETPNKAILN
jgi:hypothetical protein